jgi:hypothetical protein
MNQSQHDELAALFAQRMNFAPGGQAQQVQQQAYVEPISVPQVSEKQDDGPIHYISSHYNHSYHIRQETLSEPSRSPPPAYHETMLSDHMAQTLRENSVDPSALLPNQLHLYANADLDQRLRLLELWRISPPSYSPEDKSTARKTPPTSPQKKPPHANATKPRTRPSTRTSRNHRRALHQFDKPASQPGHLQHACGQPQSRQANPQLTK